MQEVSISLESENLKKKLFKPDLRPNLTYLSGIGKRLGYKPGLNGHID